MKLITLTLPLSLTIGLAAAVFAADQTGALPVAAAQPLQTQASAATVIQDAGKATKDAGLKKGKLLARKHGKGKQAAKVSPQQAVK